MQSFGERLRQERETRNTTIEEISAATGIHRGFLEALEKNEFESLPGSAFGKFYLRAYAETGAEYISVGAITHSATALDIALDIVPDLTTES
jgi:transcriptional regulator with XRE-family HTH domain